MSLVQSCKRNGNEPFAYLRDVLGRVVEVFGEKVFDTLVTRTVRFPETTVAGEPITTWAPRSPGAQAYRALAREVIQRGR